jgi:hypothetical protein
MESEPCKFKSYVEHGWKNDHEMNGSKTSLSTDESVQKVHFVAEFPEPSVKESIGVSGILNRPALALVKTNCNWAAYVLADGLTSLVTNPSSSISSVNKNLRENGYNTALILNPVSLAADKTPALQQVRELPVSKIVAPEDMRVSSLARAAAVWLPIVMFFEREDFVSRNYKNVADYGEIDLATWVPTNI